MLVGYMRVSKADGSQTTDLQRDAPIAAGVEPGQLYEDRGSVKKEDRPALAACLKGVRRGDTLQLWKLDRLGRDLRHLVNIVCPLRPVPCLVGMSLQTQARLNHQRFSRTAHQLRPA